MTKIIDSMNIVYNVVIGFSMLLYGALVVCLIVKRKELSSPFFSVCLLLGISDMLHVMHRFVYDILIIRSTGLTESLLTGDWNQTDAHIRFIFNFYIYYVNVLGVVLLTINRFTAIVYKLQYKQMWTRNVLLSCSLATWVLPLPLIVVPSIPSCQMMTDNFGMDFYLLTADPTCMKGVSSVSLAFDLLFVVPILSVLYVWMCVDVIRERTNWNSQSSEAQRLKVEARLALIGLVLTVSFLGISLAFAAYQLWPAAVIALGEDFWSAVLLISSNTFNLSNVYTLLAFSTEARTTFIQFIKKPCS